MKVIFISKLVFSFFLLLIIGSLFSCSGKVIYKNGTYSGKSQLAQENGKISANGYGLVTITIKDNKIIDCSFLTYEADGRLKDSDYGKEGGRIANRDYYNKAQKAVAACDVYASELVRTGSVGEVDAISGATINHAEFTEAAFNALDIAEAAAKGK